MEGCSRKDNNGKKKDQTDVDNERNLEIIQRVALQEIDQNADSDEVQRKEVKRETDKRK